MISVHQGPMEAITYTEDTYSYPSKIKLVSSTTNVVMARRKGNALADIDRITVPIPE